MFSCNEKIVNITKSIRFLLFVLLLTNFVLIVFGNDNGNEDQNHLPSKFDEEKGKTQTWFFEMNQREKPPKSDQEQVEDFEERVRWAKKQPQN